MNSNNCCMPACTMSDCFSLQHPLGGAKCVCSRHGSLVFRVACCRPILLACLSLLTAMVGCAPAPVDDGRVRVGAIVFQEDQYFRLVEIGMRDAARETQVQLMVNNSFNSLDKEITLLDTYLANQVHALVVAPLSSKGSVPALRRAAERKVAVVTFDSHIDADFPVASIRSDQFDLGRTTGVETTRFIKERMNGHANIALITTLGVSPELGVLRVQGFREEVQKLPGVKIVVSQDAWLAPEATVVVENLLTAHPEINLVWAANEGGTVGAVTAVVNKGLAGRVFVFGTDMSEQLGEALLATNDVLQAVTGQRPHEIGRQAILAAVNAHRGLPVERHVTLPGVLFTRTQPTEVRDYLEFLRKVATQNHGTAG